MSVCHVCGLSVLKDNIAVYRQSPLGEVGVFACAKHNRAIVASDVKSIVNVILKDNELK